MNCAATSSSSTITPGAADSEPLRQAFESHLEQTRGQIERLDQVFEQLDLPKRAKKCEAMEGLIEEARSHMDEIDDGALLDVGMIICAQKVEHYEIAGYGSLVALAGQLGHGDAVSLLEQTLSEEKQADQKLTELAMSVNAEAGDGAADEDAQEAPSRPTAARGNRRTAARPSA